MGTSPRTINNSIAAILLSFRYSGSTISSGKTDRNVSLTVHLFRPRRLKITAPSTNPRITTTFETPAVLESIQPSTPESSGRTVIMMSTVDGFVSFSSNTVSRIFFVPSFANVCLSGSPYSVTAWISFSGSPSSSKSAEESKSQLKIKFGMSDEESVVSFVQMTNSSPTRTVSFSGLAAAFGFKLTTVTLTMASAESPSSSVTWNRICMRPAVGQWYVISGPTKSQSSIVSPFSSRSITKSTSQQTSRVSKSEGVSLKTPVKVSSLSSPTGSNGWNCSTVGATLDTRTQPLANPLLSPSSSIASIAMTCEPEVFHETSISDVSPVVSTYQLGSTSTSGCQPHVRLLLSFRESCAVPFNVTT